MSPSTSEIAGPKGSRRRVAAILLRAGVLVPARPDRTLRQLWALRRWGPTVAGGYRAAAARSPKRIAVVDERRSVTFKEIQQRALRLSHGLETLGATPGSRVAVLCRNHAWLVETVIAAAELGADVMLMNTGLSPRATADVLRRHGPAVVVADAEFAEHVAVARLGAPYVVAWLDEESAGEEVSGEAVTRTRRPPGTGRSRDPRLAAVLPALGAVATVDSLVADSPAARRKPPRRPGRLIVLTSGTTGLPKAAYRANPPGLAAAASLLSRIPLRSCESILVATPLFHMWGLAALQIGMPLRDTLVLHRRFEPKAALAAVAAHRCAVVFGVPVVVQRLLELPPDLRDSYDASCLRVVATSGAATPSPVVTRFMDVFGDVLYNFYGSTEVSWAAVAEPADLRIAPTTAGRPPLDSRLKVLDLRSGEVVPRGVTGRIFVANSMLFHGYTAGDTKEFRGGYMATNDLGHLDSSGRLFVHGRDADMILCSGEGLFPRQVEDLLATLPEVREAVAVGVPDAHQGQRFAAYVVLRPGADLTAAQVRTYVARALPASSVPRDVVFVDALPRNATGKVMVRDLPPSLVGS